MEIRTFNTKKESHKWRKLKCVFWTIDALQLWRYLATLSSQLKVNHDRSWSSKALDLSAVLFHRNSANIPRFLWPTKKILLWSKFLWLLYVQLCKCSMRNRNFYEKQNVLWESLCLQTQRHNAFFFRLKFWTSDYIVIILYFFIPFS